MDQPLRRSAAGAIALAALWAVGTRIWLNMDETGNGLAQATWVIFRFFTVWTNFAVGVLGLWILATGGVAHRITGMLLLAILATGLVFHILLAHLFNYEGLEIAVDFVFHTGAPAAFLLYWLVLEPKDQLRFADIPIWLSWPLVYCIYALVRGGIDGEYPYFFLDLGKHGVGLVAGYVAGLLVAFSLGALGLIALGRWLAQRTA